MIKCYKYSQIVQYDILTKYEFSLIFPISIIRISLFPIYTFGYSSSIHRLQLFELYVFVLIFAILVLSIAYNIAIFVVEIELYATVL